MGLGHGTVLGAAQGVVSRRLSTMTREWGEKGDHPTARSRPAKALASVMVLLVAVSAASGQDRSPEKGPKGGRAAGAGKPPAAARAQPAAATPADAAAADEPAAAPPVDPYAAVPTEAARRFHDSFYRIVILERQTQKREQESLGAENPTELGGTRLDRWRRINREKKDFKARLSELPKKPLAVPPPRARDRSLKPLESVVLSRLTRALEVSRDTKRLNPVETLNKDFQETDNWIARDQAVQRRDHLFERELLWLQLTIQAQELVAGSLPDEQLSAILATLDEISPETKQEASLVERLVTDEALQAQVLAELSDLLAAPAESSLPIESDEELLASLPDLNIDLLERSGLVETFQETEATETELTAIEERLADKGVNAAGPEKRVKLQNRMLELMRKQNELRKVWNTTEPNPQAAQVLRVTQDALIRRRMDGLGPQAALFGHRYDLLLADAEEVTRSPARWWSHLEAQAQLISALDEARPAPHPLEGLDLETKPLPVGPITAADLAKPINKPKTKGKKKGGKKGGGRP